MFGTFDMAGNVKEWATNSSTDGRRYLLGGSWVEESHTFTAADARSAFSRDRTYGFRCVRRTTSLPDEVFQFYFEGTFASVPRPSAATTPAEWHRARGRRLLAVDSERPKPKSQPR